MADETILKNLTERIEAEQDLHSIMYGMLKFCTSGRTTSELIGQIGKLSNGVCVLQEPGTIISWLKNAGGLKSETSETGEDIWFSTEEGIQVAEQQDSPALLSALFTNDSEFKDLYIRILEMCITPSAKDTIESVIEPVIGNEHTEIFPAYFIGALEDAGGLEWNGKWKTTDKGAEFLKSQI